MGDIFRMKRGLSINKPDLLIGEMSLDTDLSQMWAGGLFGDFKINDYVTATQFGAKGDGVTDDTVAIQRALDTGKSVFFPEPDEYYKVTSLQLNDEQSIMGRGKHTRCLVGDGVNPVITAGIGDNTQREHSIVAMRIENSGSDVVFVNKANDFYIFNSYLSNSNGNGLNIVFSPRVTIRDNRIQSSGNFEALKCLDNINGLLIDGNKITGGSAGRAMLIGQSQSVAITNNIIESSLEGIWVASTNEVGDGNCNGLIMHNNYVEQCSSPFVIGKVFTVSGGGMKYNYVSNSNNNVIPSRVATIQHGRLKQFDIKDNVFAVLDGVEDLIHMYFETPTDDIRGVVYKNNEVINTPANMFLKFGTYASTGSKMQDFGEQNYYDFIENSFEEDQVYITPTLKADVTVTDIWNEVIENSFGGNIKRVEIINAQGDLSACQVALGDSANFQVNVASVDISTLTLNNNKEDLTISSEGMDTRVDGYSSYKVTAGTGTGTFRIKIVYNKL